MAHSLKFYCGQCEGRRPHPVTRTWPERFVWDGETTGYFELVFGRDLEFRKRERVCSRCHEPMTTVEASWNVVNDMVTEIHRLSSLLEAHRAPEPHATLHGQGAVALVEDMFASPASKALQRGNVAEFAAFAETLEHILTKTLSPEEAQGVRFAYRLWGAPLTPPSGCSKPDLLSKLRQPQRSQPLQRFADLGESERHLKSVTSD